MHTVSHGVLWGDGGPLEVDCAQSERTRKLFQYFLPPLFRVVVITVNVERVHDDDLQ